MKKYEYRICAQGNLGDIERLVRRRQAQGFEIDHDAEHLALDECFQAIDKGNPITVSMKRAIQEVPHVAENVS